MSESVPMPAVESESTVAAIDEAIAESAESAYRRDRLLAGVVLTTGTGVLLGLPFALRAGAEFFLPVTTALVVAVALVPLLEWLEHRRVPSPVAAGLCVILFLGVVNIAIAAIVVPATGWFALLPQRIDRIRTNLKPVLKLYATLERFVNETAKMLVRKPPGSPRTVVTEPPNSLLDLLTSSAPHALVQMFFGILVVFFFLSGWTRMRERTITRRTSFSSSMNTARVIRDMVRATSAYLGTITLVNLTLGSAVALGLWLVAMPTPLMWGGLVVLMNYVPYLGPIVAAMLLAIGGLMTFSDVWYALLPAAIFIAMHLIEANVVTPLLVGHRLTINPFLILIALSYWGWVWGTIGALLAVPLLILAKTVLDAVGKPDIAGFLFEDGTLGKVPDDGAAAGGAGGAAGR